MSAKELQKPTFLIVKCAGIASKMLAQFCLKDSNVLFYFFANSFGQGLWRNGIHFSFSLRLFQCIKKPNLNQRLR